jgi:hypothetical protein
MDGLRVSGAARAAWGLAGCAAISQVLAGWSCGGAGGAVEWTGWLIGASWLVPLAATALCALSLIAWGPQLCGPARVRLAAWNGVVLAFGVLCGSLAPHLGQTAPWLEAGGLTGLLYAAWLAGLRGLIVAGFDRLRAWTLAMGLTAAWFVTAGLPWLKAFWGSF